MPFAAIRLNKQLRMIECNRLVEELTGYNQQELTRLDITCLLNQEVEFFDALFTTTPCNEVSKGQKIELTTKGNASITCQIFMNKHEQDLILYLTKRLTESQSGAAIKQGRYLQLSEKFFNAGHWCLDITEDKLFWSDGVYEMHGVNKQSYHPTLSSAINFYTLNERTKVKHFINYACNEKRGFHFKSSIVHALGKKIKVEVIGEVELNDNGEVQAIYGLLRDISKSEEAFEKLKLLALVNYTITVPIFFIDDKDNVVYQDLSPQMGNQNAILFNYINFSVKQYLHYKRLAKEKGQIKEKDISFDKYNSVFDFSVTYEPDESIYIWIVENTTEKFRQEQQQFISNRLALLGNTFGNVSHDINNVLGVALGATEMLELKAAKGESDISKYIERVKNAIDKGKTVTERLLAFTRKPTVKVTEFDPIKEIEDNLYLFKQLLLNTISFNFEHNDVKCVVMFPQGEFINILLNIVLNAQDAIREQSTSGQINLSVHIKETNKLRIRVKDSGIGIKQENLSKIFDPFYSSKSVNKGNGIGLANVYSTMYKYDGEIQVAGTCELGGAEFSLFFPCKSVNDGNVLLHSEQNGIGIEGKSVLILDDEISIAEFVSLFLDDKGAKTHFVTNKKSLEDTLATGLVFDIFITDMILPDLSGREAVEMVKAVYPNIKVFSMSGYIAEENTEWHYPVLRKPFNSKELANFLKDNG